MKVYMHREKRNNKKKTFTYQNNTISDKNNIERHKDD